MVSRHPCVNDVTNIRRHRETNVLTLEARTKKLGANEYNDQVLTAHKVSFPS